MNIRELARLAGVSKTTAAYAMQNNPRVSLEVRERVQLLANNHGYKSNPLIRAYMSEMRRGEAFRERLYSLCYLGSMVKDGRYSRLQSYQFEKKILEGAIHESETLGYSLEIITLDPATISLKRLNQIFQARGIRGVFVGPGTIPFADLNLNLDQLAAILYGYTIRNPELDRITADLMQAVFDFAKKAFHRKYKTIIFAIDRDTDDRVGNRWTSGAGALREFHGGRKIRIIRDWKHLLPQQLTQLLKKCKAPVVFGHSSLIKMLSESGVRVPQDTGFVAFNDDIQPHHTAILQPHYKIGRLGIERLSTKVERAQWGVPETPARTVLECGWHEGETLPEL